MTAAEAAPAELQTLWTSTVEASQIDHLGHMNVRYYLVNAIHATRALAARLGLGPEACEAHGARLGITDTFTRHYREQLVGAPLEVRSGVLEAEGDGLRFYHELRNTERDELSAAFVHRLKLQARDTRRALPLPELVAGDAVRGRVAWPEHGRPRSLDLTTTSKPSFDTVRERELAMREVRVIRPEECDEDGFFQMERYQDLVWGGTPAKGRGGMPLHETEDGRRMGWATLESRGALQGLPRAGDRVQSFGAEVDVANKTTIHHNWVFDVDGGELLCTSSVVNLAFDIGARRAIEIPPALRARLEASCHADLR